MDRKREPKKSETLEVRLPHEVKNALMRKAQAEGRSASEIIRQSIDAYLADRAKEKPNMLITAWKPIAVVGAAAAAILWTALAPAPLAAGPDLHAAFNTFDRNKDGTVTLEEFRAGHADDRLFVHSGTKAGHDQHAFMIPLHHDAKAFENGMPVPAAMLKAEFAKEDTNHNGSVDFAEFKQFHVAMMNAAFAQIDRNKDGAVDAAEFAAVAATLPAGAPHANFAQIDSNHDGKLEPTEFFGHMK
jgi:Ca2+-binding EF-hand superfamily protein